MLCSLLFVLGCNRNKVEELKSDPQSEAMLAGVWLDSEDESVVFKAVGDTLYYKESNSVPVHFRIYGDTLYVDAATPMKYFIEKFTPNVFNFRTSGGDKVRLVKSEDSSVFDDYKSDDMMFDAEINQTLVKRDTVVMKGDKRYHCYMQVNPTTYKVYKTDYNADGVGISKVFYDNIINVAVFDGANKVFSSDFNKNDFAKFVPADVLKQSILSDITYDRCDEQGVVFDAILRIPESAAGYLVNITVSPNGKKTLSQP